jgi:hypothetical protein
VNRTGDIIALVLASLACAIVGWAAVHISAKFEQQRAIHLLEKYGPTLRHADSPRQPRWVSLIRSVFHENDALSRH